jgi:integrase
MARQIHRLSAREVATKKEPGLHADGGGLYMVVDKGGAKRWTFLFRWEGKRTEMGLGGLQSVPLARARELGADCRAMLAKGLNPVSERKAIKSTVPTFGTYADEFVIMKGPSWRSATHRDQWAMTLTNYAAPLRNMPIDTIATEHILAALKPLWLTRTETAARLRGRIETILDAARASGHRTGENPARWRGHLDHLLPKREKLSRAHLKAMSFDDVPAFFKTLRSMEGLAPLALEFAILTAARSGEVLGAQWDEIDVGRRLWIIPAERMKAGVEHRVPLCDRAMEIVRKMDELRDSALLFRGQKSGRPLGRNTLVTVLRRANVDVTAHGFRSAFRDWCGERTAFPRDVAEAALAHAVGDETERAYRRGDALEKRRKLMDAWAKFCEPKRASNVVAVEFGSAR